MTSSIPVFDADSHLAEVPDLWTSRLPISKWGDDVPHVVYDERLKRDRQLALDAFVNGLRGHG